MKRPFVPIALAAAVAITGLIFLFASYLHQGFATWLASLSDAELAMFRSGCILFTVICLGFLAIRMRSYDRDSEP